MKLDNFLHFGIRIIFIFIVHLFHPMNTSATFSYFISNRRDEIVFIPLDMIGYKYQAIVSIPY